MYGLIRGDTAIVSIGASRFFPGYCRSRCFKLITAFQTVRRIYA